MRGWILGVIGVVVVLIGFYVFMTWDVSPSVLSSEEFRIRNANGETWNLLSSGGRDYLGGNDYREVESILDEYGIEYEDQLRKFSKGGRSIIYARSDNVNVILIRHLEGIDYKVALKDYSNVEMLNIYANDLNEWFVQFRSEEGSYFWRIDSVGKEDVLILDDDIRGSLYSDDFGKWYLVNRVDGHDGVYFLEGNSFVIVDGVGFEDMEHGVFRTRLFANNGGEWYLSIEPHTRELRAGPGRNYNTLTYKIEGARAYEVEGLPKDVTGIRFYYGEEGEWIAEIKYCSGSDIFPCDIRSIFRRKVYYYVDELEARKLRMRSFHSGGFETCVYDCIKH